MIPKKLAPHLMRGGNRFSEKDHAQNKKLEWDDDSKKSHPALAPQRFQMRDVVEGELANLVVSGNGKPSPVRRYVVGQIHDTHDCSLRIVKKHMAAHRNRAVALP